MMYHIQPWMIIGLLPLSAFFEGVAIATTDNLFRFTDYSILFRNLGLTLLGALIAFMLEFSEFLLVCQTSSLTLSIAGIFKVGVRKYSILPRYLSLFKPHPL